MGDSWQGKWGQPRVFQRWGVPCLPDDSRESGRQGNRDGVDESR